MRARKPKTFNWRSQVRGAARRIWMWSPARREAIRSARIAPNTVQCASCKSRMVENPKDGANKQWQVDHTEPASEAAKKIHDWNDWFERLFCPPDGMKILCVECHDKKTKRENKVRRRY